MQFKNEALQATRLANFISAFMQVVDPKEVFPGTRVTDKPLTEDQMIGRCINKFHQKRIHFVILNPYKSTVRDIHFGTGHHFWDSVVDIFVISQPIPRLVDGVFL